MPQMIGAFISELQQEVDSTRRLLQIVPADKLEWRPHMKSMTLGQLALHIASLPGAVSNLVMMDGFDASAARFQPPQPGSKEEILKGLDEGIASAKEILGGIEDEKLMHPWRLSNREKEVFTIPRIGVVRTLMLNHWYHHRGQLTVYLRLLDVPLPVTYGRSADVNPFA